MLRQIYYSLLLLTISTNLLPNKNLKTHLKGQIQTSDGQEAPFVTVVIKDF